MLQIFEAFNFFGGMGGNPIPVATNPASHVASVPGANNATTSDTIVIPTVQTNDLLLLFAVNKGATAVPTVVDDDTGGNTWSRWDGGGTDGYTAWYKRATVNTSGKTITASGFTTGCVIGLSVYRDTEPSMPLPIENLVRTTQSSGVETHPGITPTRNRSIVCLTVLNRALATNTGSETAAVLGALTQRLDLRNDVTLLALSHNDKSQANVAATGQFSWTQANGGHVTMVYDILSAIATGSGDGGIQLWRRRRRHGRK